MSRTSKVGAIFAATAVILAFSGVIPALADHSVSGKSNGNNLKASITKTGNIFTCSGTNTHAGAFGVQVSIVCQYKSGGQWHDMKPGGNGGSSGSATVTETYDDNPCTDTDRGANLPNGVYEVRAQADGYWWDLQANVKMYTGTLVTTRPYYSANC